MFAGVGQGGDELDVIDVAQPAGGHVRDALFAVSIRHPSHLHGANEAAEVVVIRLHDFETVVGDQPARREEGEVSMELAVAAGLAPHGRSAAVEKSQIRAVEAFRAETQESRLNENRFTVY